MHLKDFVLEGLADSGVKCIPIIDQARPTTHKNAYVCGDYRLLKVDTLDNRSITDKQARANSREQIGKVQGRCGRVQRFPPRYLQPAHHPGDDRVPSPTGAFRVADSQVASRWGNILEFKGFDLITPNEREARFALADQDTGVRPLAAKLHEEADCKTVILKLGDRGVLTCRARQGERSALVLRRRQLRRACDRCGRGRRCSSRLCNACAVDGRIRGGRVDPRLDGGRPRMRMRRQHSDRALGAAAVGSILVEKRARFE